MHLNKYEANHLSKYGKNALKCIFKQCFIIYRFTVSTTRHSSDKQPYPRSCALRNNIEIDEMKTDLRNEMFSDDDRMQLEWK